MGTYEDPFKAVLQFFITACSPASTELTEGIIFYNSLYCRKKSANMVAI